VLISLIIFSALFTGGIADSASESNVNNHLELFAKFPVEDKSSKTAVKLDLQSHPLANSFRTQIREGLASGPNFAGHYTVVEIGCGTACQNQVVVDLHTGRIVAWEATETGASYRLDSSLLILNSDLDMCDGSEICETEFKIIQDGELVTVQPLSEVHDVDLNLS